MLRNGHEMTARIVFAFISIVFSQIVLAKEAAMPLPDGFVYLEDVNPTIIQDMRYPTANNFLGRPVTGYESNKCIISEQAAGALSKIQTELAKHSYGLKVFDCYRPQMAVDDFIAWSEDPRDQTMKADYYPRVNKADLFDLGYIAKRSGHTRGSSVDLTLVRINTVLNKPIEVPMGTNFDFLDELSHTDHGGISGEARRNRMILKEAMVAGGFEPYWKEWWHFTLKDEPFPDIYHNFKVK